MPPKKRSAAAAGVSGGPSAKKANANSKPKAAPKPKAPPASTSEGPKEPPSKRDAPLEPAIEPPTKEQAQAATSSGPLDAEERRGRYKSADDGFGALMEPFYYGKGMSDPINTARDKWNLLPAFLKVKGLVKQHIDSFNYFVDVELKKIVKANAKVVGENGKFHLEYTDIWVDKPTRTYEVGGSSIPVTPNEARLRDLTYAAPIYVNIRYSKDATSGVFHRRQKVQIGRMPIMLRSNKCVLNGKTEAEMSKVQECPLDPGGYFVVNGTEKVILVQEQLSKNRVIVETDPKKDVVTASVTSSTHERKSKTYVNMKKGHIYLTHNVFTEDIPIVVVFKAMGLPSDKEILLSVAGVDSVYQELFLPNFEDCANAGVFTQQQALEFVGSRIKVGKKAGGFANRLTHAQEGLHNLANIVVAHIPVESMDFKQKALYVAFMARRVIMAKHDASMIDDRDYVGNKRLELAGQMLALLFEDLFKKFNTDIQYTVNKLNKKKANTGQVDPHMVLQSQGNHITQGMSRAISTGNWNLKRFRMNRAGVTHVLSRLSYISALGMMTRITSQFEKTRKVSGPRALQPSQFGMLCLADTPEGEACGLVKNLALMTHITTNDEAEPILKLVEMLGADDITGVQAEQIYTLGSYIIFVNGTPVAVTRDPKGFLHGFRGFRRMGRISEFVSININHHHSAVHIATDDGRICRPLIVVENGKSMVIKRHLEALRKGVLGFDDFLARGLVEYVDVNEENESNIAMYESDLNDNSTHLEIEPFTVLGAVAGVIPYPHHNQSPRNTYQCAMGKQAIGAIASNQNLRIDTLLYLMVYPQKPMVKTRTIELIKYDKLPAAQNAMVAVMSYSGYDIEDALVLNKASCDRGFARVQVFRKYATSLRKHPNGTSDEITPPRWEDIPFKDREQMPKKTDKKSEQKADKKEDKHAGQRIIAAHSLLGHGGVVEVGEKLTKDKVLINKVSPVNTMSTGLGSEYASSEMKDAPVKYRLPDPSYVDRVLVTMNEQDNLLVKVRTRQTRRPEVGDKFSSRHGQKGVTGLIAEQIDMPFNDQGICPDMIMNPHGFPSRMTVGKLMELLSGKAGLIAGELQYGTCFGGSDIQEMADILVQAGFSYSGKDYLTSGITGEPLPAYVFFGPVAYQRLKHMVQDKMHSRATGPRAILTRQPTEGRSRDGGLRLGEMERDCLIAYGASQLLLERLMLSSDAHEVDICGACGMMGYLGYCQSCKRTQGVTKMTIPYAAKLLIQELLSMNVKAALKLDDTFPMPKHRILKKAPKLKNELPTEAKEEDTEMVDSTGDGVDGAGTEETELDV